MKNLFIGSVMGSIIASLVFFFHPPKRLIVIPQLNWQINEKTSYLSFADSAGRTVILEQPINIYPAAKYCDSLRSWYPDGEFQVPCFIRIVPAVKK